MELDYGILEEYSINKEEALTHVSKSAQVKKYVEGICNKQVIKSTRTRQAKGLKELLRNIKEWNCTTCNIKHYQRTSYNRHLTSVEHKAKLNGLEKPIVCSMASCRKKFGSNEELEEHLQLSPKCIKSPTNKTKDTNIKEKRKWEKYYDNLKDNYGNMKHKWERQKELYNLFNYSKETMTDLDKEDYNIMISQEYNDNEDYELVKDENRLLIVKHKGLTYTKKDITIKPDTKEEEEWNKREKEIEEEDKILAQKIQIHRQAIIDEAKRLEEEKEMKMYERDFYGEVEKSKLRSDKYLGGPSSDSEYEEIEITDDEE